MLAFDTCIRLSNTYGRRLVQRVLAYDLFLLYICPFHIRHQTTCTGLCSSCISVKKNYQFIGEKVRQTTDKMFGCFCLLLHKITSWKTQATDSHWCKTSCISHTIIFIEHLGTERNRQTDLILLGEIIDPSTVYLFGHVW